MIKNWKLIGENNSFTYKCLEVGTLRYRWMPTERGLRTLSFDQRCHCLPFSCILFVFFSVLFCIFCTLYVFLYFSYSLNWKTLYLESPLTKRSAAPFLRSNSEVDFCPFVSCLKGGIQY